MTTGPVAAEERGPLLEGLVLTILRAHNGETNVIVAVAKGLRHEVVVRGLGSYTVVTSTALLDELERTLRAKFTLGPTAMAFLEQLHLLVRLAEPAPLASPVSPSFRAVVQGWCRRPFFLLLSVLRVRSPAAATSPLSSS